MTEERAWTSLGEAFDLIAATPEIKARATRWLEEYTQGWDMEAARVKKWLNEFSENWGIKDAINRVTEEAMSEAGRLCDLRFRGLKGEDEKERSPIPTTWFEERDSRSIATARGVDPDSDMLCFAPLHEVHDENFHRAVDFEVSGREPTPRWFDVVVETKTLVTFLKALGGAMPGDAADRSTVSRGPTLLQQAIKAVIAKNWPNGMPTFPSVKERNKAISALLNRPVSDDTFERYFSKK